VEGIFVGWDRIIFARLRELARGGRSASLCALVTAMSACVGGISDPERFGDGTSCAEGFEIEVLFEQSCGGQACHGGDGSPAGGLDLVTPGFAERMINVPSQICSWSLLVVPGDAESSFLYVKITDPPIVCGDRMPPVGFLTNNEVRCVRDWIESLAAPTGDPELDPDPDAGAPEAEPL
jgi:hypothetical protein